MPTKKNIAHEKAIKLRTVFMGTSHFALPILEALIANQYNIVAIYTKSDQKIGRKREDATRAIADNPIRDCAKKHAIPLYQPLRFDDDVIETMRTMKPDLIIVAAYGKIIPSTVLALPGFGAINVHPSLLPKFRGPSPIQNALLMGDKETGTTIMLMNEDVDAGDILAQKKIPINPHDTTGTLMSKAARTSADLLLTTLPAWVARVITPKKQDERKATLCQLIERSDGHLSWHAEAQEIYNRYRALMPWPGVFSFWRRKSDDSLVRIKLCSITMQENDSPSAHTIGEVFLCGERVGIQTLDGIIFPEKIQMEGKGVQTIETFRNGCPDFVGSVLQ